MRDHFSIFALGVIAALVAGCVSDPGDVELPDSTPETSPTMLLSDPVILTANISETISETATIGNEHVDDPDLEVQFEVPEEWFDVDPTELIVAGGEEEAFVIEATCPDHADELSGLLLIDSNAGDGEQQSLSIELSCLDDEPVETGDLNIEIEGLPDGTDADVTITGPQGFDESAPQSVNFEDLAPGTYEILAAPVGDDPTYVPVSASQNVEVTSGETTTVNIEYIEGEPLDTGELSLEITGLPDEIDAMVTIEGPEFISEEIAQSTTFDELMPGEYEIIAAEVSDDPTFSPSPTEQTVEVEAGERTEVTIEYTELIPSLGALDITFDGLPEDLNGQATIEGPDGYSETIAGAALIEDLQPGEYQIIPDSIDDSPAIYEADEETIEVVGTAETDAQEVTIEYAVIPGSLHITVEGLPDGTDPGDITLENQADGSISQMPDDLERDDIEPGTYTVIADDTDDGSDTYIANPQDVLIESDELTEARVEYLLNPGVLTVDVSGLPDGVDHDIAIVSESGEARDLPSTGEIQLPGGSYTVVANPVEDGPARYEADDIEDVEITGGEDTSVEVTYEVIPGELHISVDGLPDDQEVTVGLAAADSNGVQQGLNFTGSTTVQGLTPGDYTVTFQDVERQVHDPSGTEAFTEIYRADPQSVDVVVASDTPGEAVGSYELQQGMLELTIELRDDELPDDFELNVNLVNDDDVHESLVFTETQTKEFDLNPGVWTIDVGTDEWDNGYVTEDAPFVAIDSAEQVEHEMAIEIPTMVINEDDDGFGSLREVVGRVNEGSKVTFASDVGSIELSEEISIHTPMTILGPDSDPVTLTTQANERLLAITDESETVIQHLRFEGGSTSLPRGGGAIFTSSNLDLVDVTFVENEATNGPGGTLAVGQADEISLFGVDIAGSDATEHGGAISIAHPATNISLNDVTISDSSADNRGGAIHSSGSLQAQRLTVSESEGIFGGAINLEGPAQIREAHFFDNHATQHGGAIHVADGGELMTDKVLFEANEATRDGGAIFSDGQLAVLNSTFSGNTSNNSGGGVYCASDSDVSITHATLTENSASSRGQAIYSESENGVVLTASYLSDNDEGAASNTIEVDPDILFGVISGADPVQSGGYNVIDQDDGDNFEEEFTDLINVTTNWEPLSDNGGFTNTQRISTGSNGHLDIPLVTEGNEATHCVDSEGALVRSDQRDHARPSGARCSRGAWEAPSEFEDFEFADLPDSADDGSFEGQQGRTWNYTDVRSAAADFPIDGEGARMSGDGEVSSADIDGGIESFSVQFRQAGASGDSRQISVEITSEDEAINEVSETFGQDGGDSTVYILDVDEIDSMDGAFDLTIRNLGEGDVTIDNISWR